MVTPYILGAQPGYVRLCEVFSCGKAQLVLIGGSHVVLLQVFQVRIEVFQCFGTQV